MFGVRQINESAGSPRRVLFLVTLALFLDVLLYDVIVPFLPGYVRRWGVSDTTIGLIFASYSVTMLLLTPLMGWLTDRVGRRLPILCGVLGLAAASLTYASADGIAVLLGARLLQGASGAALWSAALALLADVFPPEARGHAMGTAMTGMSLGALLGPPLGGVLYVWGSFQLPFVLAAALCALIGIALYAWLPEPASHERHVQRFVAQLRNGPAIVIAGVVFVGATVLSMLEPILPLHLEDRLFLEPDGIGLLFGIATLAYGASSMLIGSLLRPRARRWGMTAGLLATALALPFITRPTTLWSEAAALVPLGIACAFVLGPTLPALADAADRRGSRNYGAIYALFSMAYAGGMLVGPLVGGALAEALGFGTSLLLVGIAVAAYAPLVLWVGDDPPREDTGRRALAA